MKKKITLKNILIFLTIIIIGILTFFVIKHLRENIKSNVVHIAPNIEIKDVEEDDGMVKYQNNIQGIVIGDRRVEEIDGKPYIIIKIENILDEDRFDIPIRIEFVNSDGDVIYNTGYVVNVLLKGMTGEVIAQVTPQIAEMVENDKMSHIVIKN